MKTLNLRFPELPKSIYDKVDHLRDSIAKRKGKTQKILISSATAGDARSVLSVELWRKLASEGKRTVLVDMDFTSSLLEDRYGAIAVEDEKFYSTNVMNGDMVLVRDYKIEEEGMLAGPELAELMEALEDNYDHIIVNAPPEDSVQDKATLTNLCDFTVAFTNRVKDVRTRNSIELNFPELPYSID